MTTSKPTVPRGALSLVLVFALTPAVAIPSAKPVTTRNTIALPSSDAPSVASPLASNGAPSIASNDAKDFARDVQPILASRCYECHGPAKQKAGLRLDVKDAALRSPRTVDVPLLVAGDSAKSLLYQRVVSSDPEERMPAKGEPLSAEQVAIIRAWIDAGAAWPEEKREQKSVDHWSFKRVERPQLPDVNGVARADWCRNPIDRFVLARLENEKLAPAPGADRRALIRRLSFDLTGLPPTLAEIDAFVADASPDAYEKVVDRLLASPSYGERMATDWLDLARYADTNGYHIDNHRDMWKWREWVIRAFNANERYDQFTIDQLAGDLVPDATQDQKLATGFNRNGPINFEGGADPDEYQTKYVIDRVNTTSTVWMGLTMACAECHDHKYDPITQKEFYSFYAFFNNIAEKGLDGEKTNPMPSLKLPSAEQAQALAREDAAIAERERALAEPDAAMDAEQIEWERETIAELPPLPKWSELALASFASSGGTTLTRQSDGSILASGTNPPTDVYELEAKPGAGRITALKLDALTHKSLPHHGAGRADNANFVLSGFEVEVVSAPSASTPSNASSLSNASSPSNAPTPGNASTPSSASSPTNASTPDSASSPSGASNVRNVKFASASADYEQGEGGFFVAKAIDDDPASGWAVAGYKTRVNREATFVPAAPIELGAGDVVRIRLRFESPYRQHGIGRFKISTTDDAQFDLRARTIAMNNWWSVGPFNAGSGSEAFLTAFPPEEEFPKALDTAKTYLGNALAWREHAEWDDGKLHKLEGERCATYLYRTFTMAEAKPILLLLGSDDAVAAWFNGERVHSNDAQRAAEVDQDRVRVQARAGENRLLVKVVNYTGNYAFSFSSSTRIEDELPRGAVTALRAPVAERTEANKKDLREHFRRMVSPRGKALLAELETHKKARVEIDAQVPQSMVMQERDEMRATNVLLRGNFQRKGDAVMPDVPAFLPPLPMESVASKPKSAAMKRSPQAAGESSTTRAAPAIATTHETQTSPTRETTGAATRTTSAESMPKREATATPEREAVVETPVRIAAESKRDETTRATSGAATSGATTSETPSSSEHATKSSSASDSDAATSMPSAPPKPAEPMPPVHDRLALARWLVSREHPLTSRVTVNHYWQMLFGTGLVKTSEDFGARGEKPSHPELLDWLAVELMESGWDVKQLLKLIVTSSTYRQVARETPELVERDPENRLLARGPRQRLSAEMIRDNALAVSGLLVSKIGGPSVHPYQPDGLWDAVSFSKDFSSQYYVQDHGDALYRRAMYTYWKRALPYPSLSTFDAPIRETCTARRPVTETPLQALVLLNDPTYVEAARHLALRMLKEGGHDDDARLAWGFQACTSREPSAKELDVLRRALARESAAYAKDRTAAEKLVTVGESKNPSDVDASVLATWTSIGSLLLNLDATVHRG